MAYSGYRSDIIGAFKLNFDYTIQVVLRTDNNKTFKPVHKRWIVGRTLAGSTTTDGYQSILKYQKRLMEEFCMQNFPLVVYFGMILKNYISPSMIDNCNDCLLFVDDLHFIEENNFFNKQFSVLFQNT